MLPRGRIAGSANNGPVAIGVLMVLTRLMFVWENSRIFTLVHGLKICVYAGQGPNEGVVQFPAAPPKGRREAALSFDWIECFDPSLRMGDP